MNRRTFLRTTTAAGAGLALRPFAAAPANEPASGSAQPSLLRVALIGAGAQGETLVEACMNSWAGFRLQFKAVCDVWENLNLRRMVDVLAGYDHRVNAYTDFRQMLEKEKELDAVLIATPDFCHAEQTVACLEQGLHVYCEAPMSNTRDGALQMVKAARDSGKLLQIGYHRRSHPRYRHCAENLLGAARLLGRITAANGQCNHSVETDRGWSRRLALDDATLQRLGYPSMHAFKNWRWYRSLGGGPLLDYGSHQIDVFNWLFGMPPSTVTARGGTYYYDPDTHQWHDTVMAILEYPTRRGVVSVQYQLISTCGYGGQYEALLGEQGAIELSVSPHRCAVFRDPKAEDWSKWVQLGFLKRQGQSEKEPAPESAPTLQARETQPPTRYEMAVQMTDPTHAPHLLNWLDAIAGKAPLACPPEAALVTTVTTLKLYEAIEAGRTLELKRADFES